MSVKPLRLTQEPSWKPESVRPVVSNGLPPLTAVIASVHTSPLAGGGGGAGALMVSVPAPMSVAPQPSMWM